jgi:DNA-binding transcriptional LysR family regulator
VGEVRRVVCASPEYLATRGVPRRPQDLVVHDIVTFDGLRSPAPWLFRTTGGDLEVTLRSRLTTNTASAAIDAAIDGLGVTRVLSYQVTEAVREGRLRLTLEEYEPAPSPVHVVYAKQGLLPVKVRAFVDAVTPALRARLISV